jgi:hypothetical protein
MDEKSKSVLGMLAMKWAVKFRIKNRRVTAKLLIEYLVHQRLKE